jgi:hypothetical protein
LEDGGEMNHCKERDNGVCGFEDCPCQKIRVNIDINAMAAGIAMIKLGRLLIETTSIQKLIEIRKHYSGLQYRTFSEEMIKGRFAGEIKNTNRAAHSE